MPANEKLKRQFLFALDMDKMYVFSFRFFLHPVRKGNYLYYNQFQLQVTGSVLNTEHINFPKGLTKLNGIKKQLFY